MAAIAAPIIGGAVSGLFGMAGGKAQANAAKYAAKLQAEEADKALNFQQQEWGTQQQNMAPWVKAGQQAVGTLGGLQNQALTGTGPLAPWTQQFQAPSLAQAQQEPGYQFALSQGTQALGRSAAASGNLLTGNTGEALTQFGQQLGEENYQNVYNRAMQQYQQRYNEFQQGQSNLFNRYASLAGLGQTATGQLGAEGQAAAQNVGNIALTGGAQQGAALQNAAYQQASGYNALGSGIASGINNLGQYAQLQSILSSLPQNQPQVQQMPYNPYPSEGQG